MKDQPFAIQLEPCPKCGQVDQVVPIVYSYVTEELRRAAERGEIYLGGCLVGDTKFYCRRCRISFGFARPESATGKKAPRMWIDEMDGTWHVE